MKKVGLALILLAVVTLAAGFAFNERYPTYTWNQKIRIVAETKSGEISGEAVSRVTWKKGFNLNTGWNRSVSGEAVILTSSDGSHLFALITRTDNPDYLSTVATASLQNVDLWLDESLFEELSLKNGRASGPIAVPERLWPWFAFFDDIHDSRTVRQATPSDLTPVFGSGAYVKSVTIEITSETPELGKIQTILPWLTDIWPNRLDGQRYETIRAVDRTANSLSANSFSTEVRR
ncbi:hypothetical protein BLJAPNOD_02129 [Ensifer sp. M14]|uniref:hypothetical protein n=1 Tax=Ensifer sp. M14 TaxID=2203782 RepID=UPI000E1C4B2A|nr:hypothetical protein [Ensifer sp. M14]RDL51001.1 hypothetical protein BLJAPNOD_02129 [Ensifer sp. M14]